MYSSAIVAAGRENLRRSGNAIHRYRLAAGHPAQNFLFLIARRITDVQLQHEAVDLRFRKRVCAFLLDRVLRRQNEERLFEDVGCAADGDLLFLHRFEERGLDLGRSSIYFVRQDDVGEDRTFLHREFSVGLIVDLRSHDIRRQKVRCKLDSTEGGIDRFSQSPHGERLREPRNSLEKYVTASQQTYEESFDHVVLPHDAAAHLSHDLLDYRCISGCNGVWCHVLLLA